MSRTDPYYTNIQKPFRTSTVEKRAADVNYIKEHLGEHLRPALASVVMHQPADPINFVANHLLKQRHADLTQKAADLRHLALQKERHRLCEEEAMADGDGTNNMCHPCDVPSNKLGMDLF